MDFPENKIIYQQAMKTFPRLASLIYLVAMIYSIATNHLTVAMMLGAAAFLIMGLVTWLIKTET